MKITPIGSPQIIMENEKSKHNYFGWPSAVRLKNGKIAVGASGFRMAHVCPFGKSVLSYSEDEGETYTYPAPVIDTVLDDRDCGLTVFGESGLILTSFNNTADFQRTIPLNQRNEYCARYLDSITPEEEEEALGVTFRISHDNGVTFGPIHHSPISSPHGPVELEDGTVLWVGRIFSSDDTFREPIDFVESYTIDTKTGEMTRRGRIPPIYEDGKKLLSCEPHAVPLPDGRILCHIRVQEQGYFTLYQSESADRGFTWTKPYQILSQKGGAPAHLLLHSTGVLISVYGYRKAPYGIRCAFSTDLGRTWSADHVISEGYPNGDLGYPATVEMKDGSLLTVYYAHPDEKDRAVILQQRWKFEM